jgi:hypothetical protein
MRVYALLLGIALTTTGYGATAELAVSSVNTGRQTRGTPAAVAPASGAPGAVWYGGVLDPITVESSGGDTHATTTARILTRPTVRCVGTDRSTFRTIS